MTPCPAVAGYVTLEVPALEDALPFALRYAACLGGAELDLRPLEERVGPADGRVSSRG